MKYLIDRLQTTKIIKRDPSSKYGFDIRFLEDKRPSDDKEIAVYYFPGSGGLTAEDANCGCKIIENGLLLSFADKEAIYQKMSVYALYYGKDDETQVTGDMTSEERECFVENNLLARCLDANGKFLSVDEICKNMAKVTFVGYCRGTVEINNILLEFSRQLSEYFAADVIDKIRGNLFCVRYAPLTFGRLCPTVSVYSMSDGVVNGSTVGENFKYYEKILNTKLDGILVDYEKPGEMMGKQYQKIVMPTLLHEGVEVFSTKMVNVSETRNEHSLSLLARNEKWEISRYTDQNLDCVSQMFFLSLAEGVERGMETERSGKLHMIEMNGLYKEIMKIELEGFSQDELKDHTKEVADGKCK